MTEGKYVVFDGMDGSGKGTQLKMLREILGAEVIFTREPGGTLFAEKIRGLIRDDSLAEHTSALANMLLFFAAREELQHRLVGPALGEGKTVFSDRGDSSTWAFQIWGEERKALEGEFFTLRKWVFSKVDRKPPDLYVIFDLPARVARERVMAANREDANHFDARDLAYYERVRQGFRDFSTRNPTVMLDAEKEPEEIHLAVLRTLVVQGILPETLLAAS